MTDLAVQPRSTPGLLLGTGFDGTFVLLLPLIGLASAAAVIAEPVLFPIILTMDLWLLGYHHVIATYTRLCFDRESLRQNRFVLFYLPPLVLAATLSIGLGIGVWAVVTVYLYWQWFHYARQSWGIAQIYRRKAGHQLNEPIWFSQLAIWVVPVWGILQRSAEQPAQFLGLPVWTLPVPMFVADVAGVVAAVVLAAWIGLRLRLWMRGELPVVQTLYLLSHFVMFAAAYVLIDDITFGWLAVNIWHNLQYLLFVWLFNNQKFRNGVDAKAPLLSKLSQTRNIGLYFAATLAITVAAYGGARYLLVDVMALAVPIILFYQTVNFHHYIVDALIWKARKKPLQAALSLPRT